jgi:hypothetical protein
MSTTRIVGITVLVLALAACSGGQPTATPGTTIVPQASPSANPGQPTEVPSLAPSDGNATPATISADLKGLAEALSPAGSTATGHLDSTGVYQLYLSLPSASVDQLKSFWNDKVPALGFHDYTYAELSGSIYIGATGPTLAIIASPDPNVAGGMTIVISVSTE